MAWSNKTLESTQTSDAVAITGGTITGVTLDNTVIGATTSAAATVTTLTATNATITTGNITTGNITTLVGATAAHTGCVSGLNFAVSSAAGNFSINGNVGVSGTFNLANAGNITVEKGIITTISGG